jgi:hypothetical protein
MGVKAAPRFFLSNEWKIRKEKGEKSSPVTTVNYEEFICAVP